MKESLYDRLGELLKTKEEYRSEDGELLKAKVYSDIMTMDKNLISLLLSDEEVKEAFFLKVDDTLVFDKQKFAWIIDSKEFLPDSYTSYTNKIGLTSDGDFISQKSDVVLDFPYKDCVLEGGQTKDDQNRKEIFYNETLAQDEIRRMLDPKVFTKAKRYTKGGVEGGITFNEDDNLIIKGNNLIALESLLKRYEGQIKCIYIDPPYNTGSDSFGYNDNFNRSTWLVFMKNRLEVAKKLLSPEGIILIQISFHEYPYLRVIADEVFDSGKHLLDFNTLVRHPERSLTGDKEFNDVIEYTLLYSRDKNYKMPKQIIEKTNDDYQYDFEFKNNPNEVLNLGDKLVSVYYPENVNIIRRKGHSDGLKSMSIRGSIREKNSSGRFYVANLEPLISKYPKGTIFTVPDMGDDGRLFRIFELPKGNNKNGFYYQGKPISSNVTLKPYPNFLNFVKQYNLVSDEGNVSFRNGKKPEEYIQFFLDILTKQNDIVLDFHLGSGTTAAVAMKMNRRFIGVEQMDYIEDITIERLKKVIDGEQGGISKAVNWQGGGSFVYCELMENGNDLIRKIENADENTVKDVKAKIYKDERIVPYITTEELESVDTEFEELTLEDKKKALIKLVDKNKLYVNYSDIDNADFNISEADKRFTKSFYEVD
ncbi:DNA methyltransferase [Peptoniphilus catoniae]|uniref:DNA methyltransferase n=1 Tax=Peptoniphilus catoniae TaxID=1660341 RepID=UPI0010FEC571|nr:site-specific DNA-methyltransferase [Peptoniphilus catoniae]